MEWIFVKMLLSLAAVLALMFGLMYVLKRYVMPGAQAPGQRMEIEVLGRKAIHPKKSVVVLKVADRVVVVGVSEQGMQTLTEFAAEECGQTDSAVPAAVPAVQTGGFAAHLQATLNTLVNRKLEKRSV
jgi:flagellar biosynthetic protein FliO